MWKIPTRLNILFFIIATAFLAFVIFCLVQAKNSEQPINLGTSDYDTWNIRLGSYIETARNSGYNILINGVNKYLNFNTISGESGYGIRDNGGTIEVKNSGGSWAGVGAGSMTALPESQIYVGNASNVATATSSVTVSSAGVLSASGGTSAQWTTAYGWGNHASAGYAVKSGNDTISGLWTFSNKLTLGNASTTVLSVSGDTYLSTIKTGTWNGTSIADAYIDNNITVDWTGLQNYPGACGVGSFITALGETPTCTSATSTGYLVSGGTLTSARICRYDGTGIDCDRLEDASGACAANSVCMGGHTHVGVNEVYGSGWDADTNTPEKDDVYDYLHLMDTDDDGAANNLDTDAVDNITEIAAALKDGSGDCASGLICLGDHSHSTYAPLASPTFTGVLKIPQGATQYTNSAGEITIDTSTNQLRYYGTATSTLINYQPASFTYATSTAWSGTTTIPLGVAWEAETWTGIACFTDAGTLNVSVNDGTNRMNQYTGASTTVSAMVLSTNNTFTALEKRYVDIGTPASSPTKISCTVKKSTDAN